MRTAKRNVPKKKKKKKNPLFDVGASGHAEKHRVHEGRKRSWPAAISFKIQPLARRRDGGRTAGGRQGRREGRLSRDNNEFFLFVSSFSPAMIHGESGYARSRKINYISKVKIEFGGGKGAGGNTFVFVRRRPPAARERQKF